MESEVTEKKLEDVEGISTIGKIYSTMDYDMFKFLEGNRNVNPLHQKRIQASKEEESLVCPIIVNENFEICDGQHRFQSDKNLGKPVYFIVNPGYGLKQVHRLNSNTANWKPQDYVDGYCSMGYQNYEFYRQFQQKYGFNHSVNLIFLNGGIDSKGLSQAFKEGELKVREFEKAQLLANRVKDFAPLYDGYKKRSFCLALLKLSNLGVYDHESMISKASQQSTKLVDCTNVDEYISMLGKIYNFNRRSGKIVPSHF